MLFSVGADGAPAPDVAGVVVVVVLVVVVVVSGAFSSLAQAAVIAPIAMIAERPEMAASRRSTRRESMVQSHLCPVGHSAARETPRKGEGRRLRGSTCCGEPREALSAPAAHEPAA